MRNLIILLSIVCLFRCSASRTAGHRDQGIRGRIIWQEGNFMPAPGKSQGQTMKSTRGVERSVRIYTLTTREDVEVLSGNFFSSVKTTFIKEVKTDQDGKFYVELPPGKYSVFTVEEEGLYANEYDSDGNMFPVEVLDGEFTEVTIKINYKAAF